jgi:hypothetical protein
MSKYFTDINLMLRSPHLGPPTNFMVKAKKIPLGVAVINSIARAMARNIPTYSIAPETIKIEENTSCWDYEMISHQLIYTQFFYNALDKFDMNLMELNLNVKNDKKEYKYVFANELKLRNKETNKEIPIDKILVYVQKPLFTLGPGETVRLTCLIEKMSKSVCERKCKENSSRHQSACVGMDYKIDEKEPDKDPEDILITVNIQVGIGGDKLVSLAINRIIDKITLIEEAIKNKNNEKYYLHINKYFRYDFVFLDEDHTIGNLLEKWINRYDSKSAIGYRQTRDKKSIIVDYGLLKYVPDIFQDKISSNNLEEVVEKSITSLDPKKEEQQRLETINSLMEHLRRIKMFYQELSKDWEKVKINEMKTSDYMAEVERLRFERQKD